MKRSVLVAIQEKIANTSKKPWACIETRGIEPDGRVAIAISYNRAFINNLHENGYQGMNDEETVQVFFLASQLTPPGLNLDVVNPAEHPNLTDDSSTLNLRR